MNYFKALALIFGSVALLKPVYMHLLPWDEKSFIAKTYGKERPRWVLGAALGGLGLIALTWYMHFTAEVRYSLVLTILVSLTAMKAVTLILDYQRFHRWVARMLARDRGRDIVLIDIGAGVFGLGVVLMGIFLY